MHTTLLVSALLVIIIHVNCGLVSYSVYYGITERQTHQHGHIIVGKLQNGYKILVMGTTNKENEPFAANDEVLLKIDHLPPQHQPFEFTHSTCFKFYLMLSDLKRKSNSVPVTLEANDVIRAASHALGYYEDSTVATTKFKRGDVFQYMLVDNVQYVLATSNENINQRDDVVLLQYQTKNKQVVSGIKSVTIKNLKKNLLKNNRNEFDFTGFTYLHTLDKDSVDTLAQSVIKGLQNK
jgi:hypothetical protein